MPIILFPPRYNVGLDTPVTQTYKDLLPGGSTVLENAIIEKTISYVDAYMKERLDYHILWELQPDALVIEFGEDMRELQEAGPSSASEDRMVVGWEELQDLKGVWSELLRIWKQVDEMKDKPWLSVRPRKRMNLLLNQLKDLLAGLRQYASHEYVKKLIQSFQKVNRLIVELNSGAVKDGHWITLCKQLRVSWVLAGLTLGQVRAGMEN